MRSKLDAVEKGLNSRARKAKTEAEKARIELERKNVRLARAQLDMAEQAQQEADQRRKSEREQRKAEQERAKTEQERAKTSGNRAETEQEQGDGVKYEIMDKKKTPIRMTDADLAEQVRKVATMDPIVVQTTKEYEDISDLNSLTTKIVSDMAAKPIESPVFGTVAVSSDGMSHFIKNIIKTTTKRQRSFIPAIKAVIEQGQIISYDNRHKNKGRDTAVIAAKVKDQNTGATYLMGVVVKQTENDNGTSFYALDVIKNVKKKTSPLGTHNGRPQVTPLTSGDAIASLLEKVAAVKGEIDDDQYQKAIKEGDTETAERLVEEEARREGYTLKLYHQTKARFNEFNTNRESAGAYDDETPSWLFFKPTAEDIGIEGDIQMPVYVRATKTLTFANRAEARAYWEKHVPGYAELHRQMEEQDKQWNDGYEKLDAEWDEYYDQHYDEFVKNDVEVSNHLYELGKSQDEYLKKWNEALHPIRRQMKNLVTKYMNESGYDCIHLVFDGKMPGRPKVESYIVKNANQIKSAETITRDDSGEVIPPSQRFNKKTNDIRYQLEDVSVQNEQMRILVQQNQRMARQVEELRDSLRTMQEDMNAAGTAVDSKAVRGIARQLIDQYGTGTRMANETRDAALRGNSSQSAIEHMRKELDAVEKGLNSRAQGKDRSGKSPHRAGTQKRPPGPCPAGHGRA